jgi:hypothetical protein
MATIEASVPREVATSTIRREARRQTTKAIKRRKTMVRKAHDLHKECGYEVLLALKKGHRSYIYTSVDTPAAIADLVRRLLE